MNNKRFPRKKHATVMIASRTAAPSHSPKNLRTRDFEQEEALGAQAHDIIQGLRDEGKENAKIEEEMRAKAEERLKESVAQSIKDKEEKKRAEEEFEKNLEKELAEERLIEEEKYKLNRKYESEYLSRSAIGVSSNTYPGDDKNYGPTQWEAMYNALLEYHGLSKEKVSFWKCKHAYHIKKGGKQERDIQEGKELKGGCLVCAKMFALPKYNTCQLTFKTALVTARILPTRDMQISEFFYLSDFDDTDDSEVLCCLDRIYHHLYKEKTLLSFEEWKALYVNNTTTRQQIIDAHNEEQRLFEQKREEHYKEITVRHPTTDDSKTITTTKRVLVKPRKYRKFTFTEDSFMW